MNSLSNLQSKLQHLNSGPPPLKSAAVAILLTKSDSHLLLVERKTRAGDAWSGQMAFPGGHFQEGDGSLLRTVMREAREEVGVELEGRLIGRLPDVVPANRPEILVAPFVSLWEEKPRILLSEVELENHFWVSLKELRDTYTPRQIPQIGREMDSYLCYARIVWGLTARILEMLFSLMRD